MGSPFPSLKKIKKGRLNMNHHNPTTIVVARICSDWSMSSLKNEKFNKAKKTNEKTYYRADVACSPAEPAHFPD